MDYFIIAVATLAGLYFHWWIYQRIRRWSDRDLALSFAGDDQAKRDYMLEQLALAKKQKVRNKDLSQWLEQAATRYSGN